MILPVGKYKSIGQRTAKQKVKVLLNERSKYCLRRSEKSKNIDPTSGIRALETTNDEEVARKIQAEWDAEEERKRFEELKKTKPKTTLRKPTSLAQERNQMMNFLKGQGYKNLQKLKYPQMKELAPVIDSPDGEYLIIHRANNHFRAFDTLWEILHILDRQDLYHLYRVVQDYYEHIPPTGLGLILLGDLTIIWETAESG
ncbi:hypothetical protein Tco_0214699 [Tanacetum coccineum]